MWEWGRQSIEEPDDDEILVYDWKNAAVPRPAGTAKLLENPSHAARKFCPPQTSSVATSNDYRFNETPLHHLPFGSGGFNNVNPYFGNSNHFSSYSGGINTHYQTGEYNFRFQQPQPRFSFPQSYHPTSLQTAPRDCWDSSRPFQGFQSARKTSQKIAHEDDDWFEIEEIDYSEKSCENPQTLDIGTSSREAVTEINVESEPRSTTATLCVPKSSLPLTEVLSELPHKSVGFSATTTGSRNSRKRPRNDLDKAASSSNLEDFLCKTKHRVSARSYAKPTRRADSTTSSSSTTSETPRNNGESQPAPVLHDDANENSTTSSALTDITYFSNECEDDIEISPLNLDFIVPLNPILLDKSIDVVNDVSIDCEDESEEIEPKLKIRTDIFEDDDE